MSIETIELWHKRARPTVTDRDFQVQLGCHFEEVVEMLESLSGVGESADALVNTGVNVLTLLANNLKNGQIKVRINSRRGFLDSVADQVVTGVGVAHCAEMNGSEAIKRIDSSNWSKFVDGHPVFDTNGKIAKPTTYQPPNLDGLF